MICFFEIGYLHNLVEMAVRKLLLVAILHDLIC